MCTSFTPTRNGKWVKEKLGVELPLQAYPVQAYPGYLAPIVLSGRQQRVQCTLARFGLIPHWAKDVRLGSKTYNARTETVQEKPSFRTAWKARQFAIALLDDFFEPYWESGRAVRWRIRRTDSQPMGVASIWDKWVEPGTGEVITSFSMLTVNADGHPVMGRFHRPGDEKRSVVVMEPESFQFWLGADPATAVAYCSVPADGVLTASTAPVVTSAAVRSLGVAAENPQSSLF